MSSYNILHVHQSEGVAFDDIAALNETLNKNWGVCELWSGYDDIEKHPQWTGWIRLNDEGEVEIAETVEHSFGGYGDNCVVYGCFGLEDAQRIAKHMTAGKLVFRQENEGWPDDIYVITPGQAVERAAATAQY